jgi:hypothetical protein
MKKFAAPTAALLVTIGSANAETYHYACSRPDHSAPGSTLRYAYTVNTDRSGARGVIKLTQHFPPHASQTFRILGQGDCGKDGWAVEGGTFCTATQGYATFKWHGLEFDCDQADTE